MSSGDPTLLSGLPGSDRIQQGLLDHAAGRKGVNACLVRIAAPRLARAGMISPPTGKDITAELELYQMLQDEPGDAYSRYNSILRELVSFERALDHRMSRSS